MSSELTYVISGMDCASCTAKVEKIVTGMQGTQNVRTSFSRSVLTLSLDEQTTPRLQLEETLRHLGYQPTLLTNETQAKVQQPLRVSLLMMGFFLMTAWLLHQEWAFVLATVLGLLPLAQKGWRTIRLGEFFGMNTLVTLAAVGALIIGEAAEGAVVVFLFLFGEWLESLAAQRARSGIQSLISLAPTTAHVLKDGQAYVVPIHQVQVSDILQVAPGERVPADGTILAGVSALDESYLTGESIPVTRACQDKVLAGTMNLSGVLHIRVDQPVHEHTLSKMIQLVEEAESSKAPTARLIDRLSRVYTPLILIASLLTSLPTLMGYGTEWMYRGISLLLIGCPCALVLSVPAAMTSGISAGARRGLLIKGGSVIETLSQCTLAAFDKTGTLTQGKPRVTNVIGDRAYVLGIAAAVEKGSRHPLAQAIEQAAHYENICIPTAEQVTLLNGSGVQGQLEEDRVAVVSPVFAAELLGSFQRDVEQLEAAGKTVAVVLKNEQVIGLIGLQDTPRLDAKAGIERLKQLGIQPMMLTGDHLQAAKSIAQDVGIEHVYAGLLPQNKLALIQGFQEKGAILMVGDGVNDAPALAQANVGIAMGKGMDVALETAQVALLKERMTDVADLLQLSRAIMSNIHQNIFFALGLKLVFLLGIWLGYTNLWMAVLADTGATVLVTANALRLLRWKPKGTYATHTSRSF